MIIGYLNTTVCFHMYLSIIIRIYSVSCCLEEVYNTVLGENHVVGKITVNNNKYYH